MIAEHSGGIPRNINNLCFNSMSLARALQRRKVDASMVQEAIDDLDLKAIASSKAPEARHQPRPSTLAGAAGLYTRWRYGWGLAAGILTSLVMACATTQEPVESLRSSQRVASQILASVSQLKTSGGSEVPPITNVPAPQDAQVQKRTEELVPTPQELQRLKYSRIVELSADEQRLGKAQAARKEEHVPFVPAPPREEP